MTGHEPAYVADLADELTERHPSLVATPHHDLPVIAAEIAIAHHTHDKPSPEKPHG